MKSKYLLLFLIFAGLAIGCKTPAPVAKTVTLKKNPYSTSAALLGHPAQGVVHLRGVSDEMPNREAAIKNAHKKAIQHLFYMGFPNAEINDMKNPMIRKGMAIESEHKAFFDQFWSSGYQQYIIENQEEYYSCNNSVKGCSVAVSNFKINYNLLRRDLERNRILNKIGF